MTGFLFTLFVVWGVFGIWIVNDSGRELTRTIYHLLFIWNDNWSISQNIFIAILLGPVVWAIWVLNIIILFIYGVWRLLGKF